MSRSGSRPALGGGRTVADGSPASVDVPPAAGTAPPAGRCGGLARTGAGEPPVGDGECRGVGALARALDRWRRAVQPDRPPVPAAAAATFAAAPAGGAAAGPGLGAGVGAGAAALAPDGESVAMLVRRLDDSGCSYGRVSAAKLEQVIRAYDRLETKLNAVLMAVTGTFLSTLAGLLLYYVRGGGQ